MTPAYNLGNTTPPEDADLAEEIQSLIESASSPTSLTCDRCVSGLATSLCSTCAPLGLSAFCAPCWEDHHLPSSPLGCHTRIEVAHTLPKDQLASSHAAASTLVQHKRTCDLHDAGLLNAFCSTCGILVCPVCTAPGGSHGAHTVVSIQARADVLVGQVQPAIDSLAEWVDHAHSLASQIESVSSALETRSQAQSQAWDDLEAELVAALKARIATLKAHALGSETSYEKSQLASEQAFFATRASASQALLDAGSVLTSPETDPAAVVALAPLLLSTISTLTIDPVPPSPHVAPDKVYTLLPETKLAFQASIRALGENDFYTPVVEASPPTPPPRPTPKTKKMPFGYFTDTNLESFPDDLEEQTHWKRLILARNFITSIPPSISVLTNLAELDLSHNVVTSLPDELGVLSTLVKLKLGGNKLEAWPDAIAPLPSLAELDLGFNALSSLPPSLVTHTSLTRLILRKNNLVTLDISPGLDALPSLTHLDLSENAIETLGHALDAMPSLTHLSLASNELVNLSTHPLDVPLLRTLIVSKNNLDRLPSWLWTCPSLQVLDASFNDIARWHAPENDDDASACATLSSLLLHHNKLLFVPPPVSACLGLDTLSLAHNELESLPDSLSSLTGLEVLDVGDNHLTVFPDSLSSLTYLVELNVYGNNLTSLPHSLFEGATGLVSVVCGNNALTSLPPLAHLEDLEEVAASGNELNEFPGALLECPNLTALYLGRNPVGKGLDASALSDMFSGRVTRGDISHAQFSDIPPTLTSALAFTTEGNPGTMPDPFMDFSKFSSAASELSSSSTLSPFDLLMAGKAYVSGSKWARFEVGMSEMIGKRPTMEDALTWHWGLGDPGGEAQVDYFGLFDGHAGTAASAFCAERLHKNMFGPGAPESLTSLGSLEPVLQAAIDKTEEELCAFLMSDAVPKSDARGGTTGLFAFFVGDQLAVANVGDSRAILAPAPAPAPETSVASRMGRAGSSLKTRRDSMALRRVKSRVRRLSMDHKPTLVEEQERIRKAKAHVAFNGRVNGNLAVSRAFGDFHLKPYVIASPYVAQPVSFSPGDILIMACDGVWDEIDDARAASIVQQAYAASGSLSHAASVLRDSAYMAGSTDNISVLLIRRPTASVAKASAASVKAERSEDL